MKTKTGGALYGGGGGGGGTAYEVPLETKQMPQLNLHFLIIELL